MTDLVFLEPDKIDSEPFTTSDIIAEYAGINYRQVQRLIEKYEQDLLDFGILRFENTVSGKAGQPKKVYNLNEQQAALVMTYLKNTERVRAFKKELVRQFFLIREELMKRRDYRVELKPVRLELTDAIKEREPDNVWAYSNYQNLAYISVVGCNAAKLRKQRGAPKKAPALDYMTSDELAGVTKLENQIAVLVDMGLGYGQIKELVNSRNGLNKERQQQC